MKAALSSKKAAPHIKQLKRQTIKNVTTTELENFVVYYKHGHGVVNTFERTAILKGIAAELAERTAETEALREVA